MVMPVVAKFVHHAKNGPAPACGNGLSGGPGSTYQFGARQAPTVLAAEAARSRVHREAHQSIARCETVSPVSDWVEGLHAWVRADERRKGTQWTMSTRGNVKVPTDQNAQVKLAEPRKMLDKWKAEVFESKPGEAKGEMRPFLHEIIGDCDVPNNPTYNVKDHLKNRGQVCCRAAINEQASVLRVAS